MIEDAKDDNVTVLTVARLAFDFGNERAPQLPELLKVEQSSHGKRTRNLRDYVVDIVARLDQSRTK